MPPCQVIPQKIIQIIANWTYRFTSCRFGVDWSTLDVRGILAITDIDEDGWSFNPLYPDYSSIDASSNDVRLTLCYEIQMDGEYQIVIKNANASKPWRLSLAVASTSSSPPEQGGQDVIEP
jgi:hypothetical protein